jgi:S1-C subfamily serine protease
MKNRNLSLYIAISISVVATLVLTVGAFTGGLLLAPYLNDEAQAATLPPAVQVVQPAAQLAADEVDIVAVYEQALIDVYQNTLPSVVNISVTKNVEQGLLDRFDFGFPHPEDSPSPNPEGERNVPPDFFNRGAGSGFVWDKEGHIVTNNHVVAGATDIEVIFADDTTVKAEIIGSDPDADLAIIKVDLPAADLTPVTLGDSDDLQVGQLSIAIGNPFGQDFTMTSGIISGVGRTIRSGNSGFSIPRVIQTDAPINPGNSGGPLLTRKGEVIGINTQMLSRSGSSAGIGFAVPINIAKQVIPTLIKGETFEYAWLGISGNTLTAEISEIRELPAGTKGAVVIGIAEDGPAEQAGLQGRDETLDVDSEGFLIGGDIITAINNQPVHDMNDLITYLVKETEPGDKVDLDVIRADGSQETVEVTLGVRPAAVTFRATNE